MLAGTGRGVGVSTIILGLIVAFKRKKISVAVGKVGSHLVQTTHYRRVSGRLATSFNTWMLTPEQSIESLARLASGAELVLLEGDRGVFDRYPQDFSFRTEAELAAELQMPVVLVVDAEGLEDGLAALVSGFVRYNSAVRIGGVICNRVRNEAHNRILREAVESLGGPVYLGGIPFSEEPLVQFSSADPRENAGLLTRSQVVLAGDLIESSIDLEKLRQVAAGIGVLRVSKTVLGTRSRACRLAVADDMAFSITFQSNLDLMRREGAELVAFSPLVDSKLPAGVKGVYLPGGYLQLYANDLSANKPMLAAIAAFAREGGVLYVEGTSIAYLFKQIALSSGTRFEMCGVLPGLATLIADRPYSDQVETYCEVQSIESSIVAKENERFRGFRDYRWAIRLETGVKSCLEIRERASLVDDKSSDMPAVVEGFAPYPNVLATAVHAHWGSNPLMARRFLEAVSNAKHSA